MPIKPRKTLHSFKSKAQRKFTNREFFLEKFENELEHKSEDEHKVLMYYGVGGIGKSSLRLKLEKSAKLNNPDIVTTVIDFDQTLLQDQENCLLYLRNHFNQFYHIPFPLFDIAYTIYWKKMNINQKVKHEEFPLLNNSTMISDIVHTLSDLPLVGIAPKLISLALKSTKVIVQHIKAQENELYALEKMDSTEIYNILYLYWVEDFKMYLQKNNSEVIFFIDTYEALWEHKRNDHNFLLRDWWVRELVAHLPSVFWVIFGREKLRWEEEDEGWGEIIAQYQLDSFKDTDAMDFLQSCGILDHSIIDTIIQSSKGVPYYLDLSVDTYTEIVNHHHRHPQKEDFATNRKQVFERFIRFLDRTEIETLKVLSAARYWDFSLFSELVTGFKTGYPVTSYKELCRFSFITEDKNQIFTMHGLMRESLQDNQEPKLNEEVHRFIFNYYDQQMKEVDQLSLNESFYQAFEECMYHGQKVLPIKEFFVWFNLNAKMLYHAGKWRKLITLYENIYPMMKSSVGEEHEDLATLLHDFGEVYRRQGKYKDSINLIKQAIYIREEHPETNQCALASYYRTLAVVLHRREGKFEEAKLLFEKALRIFKEHYGEYHEEIALTLYDYASFYRYQYNYDQAVGYFELALKIREEIHPENNYLIGKSLKSLAFTYQKLRRFELAKVTYDRSIQALTLSVGLEHPTLAMTLNNLGTYYHDVAEYEKGEEALRKAIEIKGNTIGNSHPYYAKSLHDLASLYFSQKRFTEASELLEEAINIRKKSLGSEHPRVIESIELLGEVKGRLL